MSEISGQNDLEQYISLSEEGPEEPPTTFVVPRHSKKQSPDKPAQYPGITPEGEALVREKTGKEFLELVEKSDPGSVIIYAGASDYPRTKSTSRISFDEIRKKLAGRENEFIFIDESMVNEMALERGVTENLKTTGDIIKSAKPLVETVKDLRELVMENPEKKAIISYPLYLKEFSMDQKTVGQNKDMTEWKLEGTKEVWTKYLSELMRKNNNQEMSVKTVQDWVESDGEFTLPDGKKIKGPKPLEVAQEYDRALQRLERVANKLFPGRPLIIEATGHSWEIDLYVQYLVDGKLDPKRFEEIAKGTQDQPTIISEFEFPVIKITREKATVTYHGKTYDIKK